MASESFFIRGSTTVDTGGVYKQTAIDTSAYVDALGQSVLRIHNIHVQMYEGPIGSDFAITNNTNAWAIYQVTTQSQSTVVPATNKAIVATGRLDVGAFGTGGGNGITFLSQDSDLLPQDWTNGYVVATESLYLGLLCDPQFTDFTVNVVLECTVEKMTTAKAMALQMSQQ